MPETETYLLKITKLEGERETAIIAQMTIDADRIKPVCAAGLGLAAPRVRVPKATPIAKASPTAK